MRTGMVLAALLAFGHAQGLKPQQHPMLESCAASPLLPDSQIACAKGAILRPEAPALGRVAAAAAANGTTDPPPPPKQQQQKKKDIWRSDEGWHGPHACAGVYCSYSRPSFAGGRGIVLVTTPVSAEEASHLPAFAAEPAAGEGDGGLFRVAEMPGKGLGLVANQPIRRGQRIMAHPPAVVVHRRFVDDIDPEEQYRVLEDAAARLPEAAREAFMAQMGQASAAAAAAHRSTGQRVHDIMHTNSFELGLNIRDGHHFGNYPEVSRFNHDCRPKVHDIMHTNSFELGLNIRDTHKFVNYPEVSRFNYDCRPTVAFYIDDSDLRHYTHAVRDIRPGEELTISYVDSLSARVVRQDRARRNWGFGCSCAHCSLPEPFVRASDQRLVRMWEAEQQLSHWNGEAVDEDVIEGLVGMYRQEGLDGSHGGDAFRLAALNYNSLGAEAEALGYARLAEEQLLLEKGPGARQVADMRDLMRDPKAHYSWRRRV
ncbi:SET domain-containing protein [Colletotrichum caudatum]|nr:SET domain-containing protein [Colletotrichum caudatum]